MGKKKSFCPQHYGDTRGGGTRVNNNTYIKFKCCSSLFSFQRCKLLKKRYTKIPATDYLLHTVKWINKLLILPPATTQLPV